jgi:hypothetical protein
VTAPSLARQPEISSSGTELVFAVYGTPAGQGQVSFVGKGRAIHTNHKLLKPWRAAVSAAAQCAASTHQHIAPPKPGPDAPKDPVKACQACYVPRKEHGLFIGPVGVELTISVAKNPTAARRGDVWPANRTSSDIDHHARAVLDALSEASVWRDDAQVVELCARKVWAGGVGIDALDRPGAVIRIWQLEAVAT